MSKPVKLVLYIVCLVGVIVFGTMTVKSFKQATKSSEARTKRLAMDTPEMTNNPAQTNAAAAVTNLTADAQNAAAETNAPAATNAPVMARDADVDEAAAVAGASTRGYTRMVTHGLGFLVFFLGFAFLAAYDISQAMAQKAQEALFADDGAPENPEYEMAEDLWKDGKYLDALNAMRAYLKKYPREQYVALRIAEIYEQNLHNPLAAALEYEEVLKKKLPPERWGWAAIHLANLYSGKLNQPDKAIALLRRIDAEYGQTGAAKKARERLAQIDPDFVPAQVAAVIAEKEVQSSGSTASSPSAAPSNLPPGFRPKT